MSNLQRTLYPALFVKEEVIKNVSLRWSFIATKLSAVNPQLALEPSNKSAHKIETWESRTVVAAAINRLQVQQRLARVYSLRSLVIRTFVEEQWLDERAQELKRLNFERDFDYC
ncbi:MAG: hypothetical protein WB424_08490 [Terracidiphilus sp.]